MNSNYQSNIPQFKRRLSTCEYLALKEIGKFVQKKARENAYSVVKRVTGNLRNAIRYRLVTKNKSVIIGIRGGKKGFYGAFFEKGTSKMPAKPFITPAAEQNINDIRLIAGKYFANINAENMAMGIIPEIEESED